MARPQLLTFCVISAWCLLGFLTQVECKEELRIDICMNKTNGCSIPWDIPFPYKTYFKPACDMHDICYECGVDFGISRLKCDNALKEHIEELCREKYAHVVKRSGFLDYLRSGWKVAVAMMKWIVLSKDTLEHCLNGAEVYYNAVRGFSLKHYVTKSEKWCQHKCVKVFLPKV